MKKTHQSIIVGVDYYVYIHYTQLSTVKQRFDEKMYKRKDGRWAEKITIDGKQRWFYAKTKPDLIRKIAAYKSETENGITFAELADRWYESVKPNLAYNTTRGYTPAVRRAKEQFGVQYAKDITPVQIDAFIVTFSNGMAQKTVSTQLSVLNMIFVYGVSKGHILFNPARDIKIPPNLPKRKVTAPSSEDIAAVKANVDKPFGLFAYMALYTGLRRGELLALNWSDVHLDRRTIDVNKSVYHINNKPYIKKPKTEASLSTVPIVAALYKVLEKIPADQRKGLIFTNKDGNMLTESNWQDMWEEYARMSGVKATPHQFRHAFATMLFEADLPPEKMQVLLRHAQFGTTLDIYTDIRKKKQEQIFQQIDDIDIE